MLQEIDFTRTPIKPKLYICKNDLNKTIISIASEAYQITQKVSLGNVSELEFNIPFKVDRHHELIDNPNINKLKNLYLIKLIKGEEIEYYIITSITDNSDDSSDYKHIKCFGLSYELSFKKLYSYSVVSYNASTVLSDILSETIWSTDYIYPEYNITYRPFDFNNVSVLDALQQVAETFNAVIGYNTTTRKISLYKLDNIGNHKGLIVSYGNLLKNITYETNTAELCTRLKAFGKDNISINGVNPTGSNYVESYSNILYPFQRDINKNVLSHSDYISDSLANAILDYEELVDSKENDYSTYLSQKEALQIQLTTEENTLVDLNTEMSIIEDNIQLANSQDPPTSTTALVVQKNAKQAEIDAQTIIIEDIEDDITTVSGQITTLQNLLKVENNFTEDQITEWNPYIIVRDFTNANFTDPKELFDAVREEFEKVREPKIVVSISIINLLEILEQQRNWDKLNLGDTISIRHSVLGVDIQAKIIDISFDYESGDINLTIANIKELLTDEERLIRDLYRSISTSTAVESSRGRWDGILPITEDVGNIFDILTGKVKGQISLAVNQNMTMTDKGLIMRDLYDPNTYLVIQNGLLAITNDNGNTWKHAITKNGIVGERVYGKLLAGESLLIQTEDGRTKVLANGIVIYASDGVSERVKLGDISDLQNGSLYGLRLKNALGTTIIGEGLTNSDTACTVSENLDSSHPVKMKFFINPNVLEVRSVKLNFTLEKFRAYETAASGGGVVSSSGGGVVSSSGGGVVSSSGGGVVSSAGGGDHDHLMFNIAPSIGLVIPDTKKVTSSTGDATFEVQGEIGDNGDVYTRGSSGEHTHVGGTHTHTGGEHTHVGGEHTHVGGEHTHGLVFGIFESATDIAQNVDVWVDNGVSNIKVLDNGGAHYNTNQDSLELAQWCQNSGWYTVSLTSTTLGRLSASIYVNQYVSM